MSTLLTSFVMIVGHFMGKCTTTSDSHSVPKHTDHSCCRCIWNAF